MTISIISTDRSMCKYMTYIHVCEMPVFMSFVFLPACLPNTCLMVGLSVCLFVCMYVCMFVSQSVSLSVGQVCCGLVSSGMVWSGLSVCVSVSLSVCVCVRVPVCVCVGGGGKRACIRTNR